MGHAAQFSCVRRRGGLGFYGAQLTTRVGGRVVHCLATLAFSPMGRALWSMAVSTSRKTCTTNRDAAVAKSVKAKTPRIRQSMSSLHTWAGLVVAWVLYAMFLTGTVSYFREEITRYMRPELSASLSLPTVQLVPKVMDSIRQRAPAATQISITLPTERKPFVSAFWRDPSTQGRGFQTALFDPLSAQALQARDTQGGDFFYAFHFNFHYIPVLWGRWLAGLCAMFMLVAIISGVITHKKIFVDFFTFRWGKGQRSWLDAHVGLSVLALPFHFMITWSGLVTLMVMYMPLGLQALPLANDRAAVISEMRFFIPADKPVGQAAVLTSLEALIQQFEQHWDVGSVGAVQLNNPADITAKVIIARQQNQRISTTPQYMVFDGVSGDLLRVKDSSGLAATTQGVLYGLHLGRFADTVTRSLYFLLSLAGTAMVGSGLVLWTVKRRAQLPDPKRPYLGFRLVERLNIATIAGLSVSISSYFWLNRLLPLGIVERATWEIHGFFIVWAGTLAWAVVRPAKKAWVELLWLSAILLALLPVLNIFTTQRHLLNSLRDKDYLFVCFDLAWISFAALHAWLALRTSRHQARLKPKLRTPACQLADATVHSSLTARRA